MVFFLNIGIATTAKILHSPDSFFWIQDTLTAHLPESIKFSEFYKGHFETLNILGHREGRVTHAFTGFFLAILGTNTFTTILVQLILKMLIVYFIYKTALILWSEQIALVSAAIYSFCPTIFFYNLVFYKEGMVQLMLIVGIFSYLKIYLKQKYIFIFPLLLSLSILLGERFYIAYLLATIALFFPLFLPVCKKNYSKIIYLMILSFLTFVFLKSDFFDFQSKILSIKKFRLHYASFSDVQNKYNYDIPYPIAFLKILFSPYFTLNKFTIFTDTSLLLIWGSLINHLIVLASVIGFFKSYRKHIIHIILWIPFILFLLFAAYISPWSGRLRDSFYPLIACYAAYYLSTNIYFQKYFPKAPDSNGT